MEKVVAILDDLARPVPETAVGRLIKKSTSGVCLPEVVALASFGEVVDELFADGVINWGRVIVLHAYAADVARLHGDVDACARIVDAKTSAWLESVGGWPQSRSDSSQALVVPWSMLSSWWNRLFRF
jgi:hypothetical protein